MDSWSEASEGEINDFEALQHSTPLRGHSSFQPFYFAPSVSPGEKTGENTETVPELGRGTDSQLAFIDISQSTGVLEDAGCSANSSLAFNDLDECDSERSQPSIHIHFSYTTCCSSRCIASMNLLELEQIQSSFSSRNWSDQRQFLFDIVIASTKRTYDTFCVDSYVLSGKKLCRKAFLSILGISCKRLRTVTRLVEAGAVNTKCTSIKIRKKTDKVELRVHGWKVTLSELVTECHTYNNFIYRVFFQNYPCISK